MLLSQPLRKPVLRRTTLTAAPLALVAGCKWTQDGTESVPEPTEPAVDADDSLVEKALAAISSTSAVVERVAHKHIGLSTPLAGLTTLHREHATALEGEVEATSGGPSVPGADSAAVALVVREEQQLQSSLIDLARSAASGALASSLASMAAGVAQQLIVLRETHLTDGGA